MKKYKVEKVNAIYKWKGSKSLDVCMEEKINEMNIKGYDLHSFSVDANYGGAYLVFIKE